jgi:hypothetical protein
MGIARGTNIVRDGLKFGYDNGYGVSNNTTATRFNKGEPTTNMVSSVQHGSGQLLAVQSVSVAYVGEEDGWSKYSLNGSWTAGTYPYSIRVANAGPFLAGVKYSTQCKIKTNVPHKFTYFASNGFSYVNVAMDHSGTNSSTYLSDEGCYLLKREGFAYSTTTTQPGYLWTRGNSETFSSSTDFVWIKNFMVERKDHCSPWTATSRSNTAGLIDLKRTTSIDVSNVSFDSNAQPTFDNTNDRITMPNSSVFNHTSGLTIESFVKFDGNAADFIFEKGNVNTQYSLFSHGTDIVFRTFHAGDSSYQTQGPTKSAVGVSNGVWHHIVGSWDGSTKRIYVDGVEKNGVSKTGALTTNSNGAAIGSFGGTSSGYYFGGEIAIVKIYDKGLSASEVKQNYNAYKNRFNT